MMKAGKIFAAVAALFAATACNGNGKQNMANQQSESNIIDAKRTLIVYFSHRGVNYKQGWTERGNTEIVAGYIQELTGADTFRIEPVKDYDSMQDYDALVELAKQEHDNDERPAIKHNIDSLAKYDTIILGSPVWWYGYPQVVKTFLDRHDLNGKTIIPFSTHEGSGLSNFAKTLRSYYPDAKILQGLAIKGREAEQSKPKVEKWLKELGF